MLDQDQVQCVRRGMGGGGGGGYRSDEVGRVGYQEYKCIQTGKATSTSIHSKREYKAVF